ncbi:MAG: response regulator [Rhodovibrionaceae bacterium]|nr:response regulator [Rhodovibrionaceae bacterium]
MARILLAEDDPSVREFVQRALALKGHAVTSVGDGEAALAALTEGGFDLVLSDVVMPGMDGMDLSRTVVDRHPGLPVLLMTGYSAERDRAHDLDTLVVQVITKPFTLQELCECIDEMLTADSRPGMEAQFVPGSAPARPKSGIAVRGLQKRSSSRSM